MTLTTLMAFLRPSRATMLARTLLSDQRSTSTTIPRGVSMRRRTSKYMLFSFVLRFCTRVTSKTKALRLELDVTV